MDEFATLDAARGQLFRAVNRAVNTAAFSLVERSALNEFLADPLAADHLLLVEAGVRALPPGALDALTATLDAAAALLDGVSDGANSKARRRDAIDTVDAACDQLTALLNATADSAGVDRSA